MRYLKAAMEGSLDRTVRRRIEEMADEIALMRGELRLAQKSAAASQEEAAAQEAPTQETPAETEAAQE